MLRIFISIVKSFSPKEFTAFLIGSALALLTGVLLIIQLIHIYTITQPTDGGSFTEGTVGQIAYLNPILARENSVDRDAITLLFASTYDLAELIEHDETFRIWNVRIKEGSVWHDNTPITSDDIVFTVQTIQTADAASPLAINWQNIVIERVSEREIRFKMVHAYALFENLLRELRPVPKKYFADLSPANIRLSAYNLKPVGSGPFVFESLEKRPDGFITQITLKRNKEFGAIGPRPYLEEFKMLYFENEDALVRTFNKGLLDGFGTFTPYIQDHIELSAKETYVPTSRYYALFFNQNANETLSSRAVRQALSLFINKDVIIKDVFKGHGVAQSGPLPMYWNLKTELTPSSSGNRDDARKILEADGWFYDDQTKTWNKASENTLSQLTYTIKIPDSTLIRQIAQSIQAQWKEAGIGTNIEIIDAHEFSESILKTRNYEMIVYGNVLLHVPDLTSFWHSNERFYPGLNFSLFEDKGVDELLSRLRTTDPNSDTRSEILSVISDEIVDQAPALFLVSPQYIYLTRSSSTGAPMNFISTPDSRFRQIHEWHTKTKRIAR